MANARPQNLDSLEGSRGLSLRPANIQYSQPLSTNISGSTAIVNYQNVSMRSSGGGGGNIGGGGPGGGGQEAVNQYYPNMPAGFSTGGGVGPGGGGPVGGGGGAVGQQMGQLQANAGDHVNPVMRALSEY